MLLPECLFRSRPSCDSVIKFQAREDQGEFYHSLQWGQAHTQCPLKSDIETRHVCVGAITENNLCSRKSIMIKSAKILFIPGELCHAPFFVSKPTNKILRENKKIKSKTTATKYSWMEGSCITFRPKNPANLHSKGSELLKDSAMSIISVCSSIFFKKPCV